jgi:anthranilate/para-aminobenzoate synthase component I
MLSPASLARIQSEFCALEERYGKGTVTLFLRRRGPEQGFSHPTSERYAARFEPPTPLAAEPREYDAIFHAGIDNEITTRSRDEAYTFLDQRTSGPVTILAPYDDRLEAQTSSPYIVRVPKREVVLALPIDGQTRRENRPNTTTKNTSSDRNSSATILASQAESIVASIVSLQEEMRAGECYLMNLTTRCPSPIAPSHFSCERFLELWSANPSRFGLFFSTPDVAIMTLSPERFVRILDNRIYCEPIKGTLEGVGGRTPTRAEAEQLWQNRKEIFEQTMVVDLVRNDLNCVSLPGTVEVHAAFFAAIAGALLQMQSTVVGTLRPPEKLGSLLSQLLPVASVTGTPKRRVTELIRQYENSPRGYYTGMFGIRTAAGEFDSTVLIRSHIREGDHSYVGVGAGITTLSNPKDEFREFEAKLRSFNRGVLNRGAS